MTEQTNLCKCGCGKPAKLGRIYASAQCYYKRRRMDKKPTKPCKRCGHTQTRRPSGQFRCKPCTRERSWSRRLGITREEFRQKYPMPDKCSICNEDLPLCFDHCHVSGHFRGWICDPCNRGLALFKDDPKLLRKAAKYLERFNYNPQPTEDIYEVSS